MGTVVLPKDIKREEVLFTHSNDVHTLISEIGEEEYFCTGNCYCSTDERRTSATKIRNGVVYLLTAISSYIAFEKAKEHFKSECHKDEYFLQGECSHENIQSEVEECTPALIMAKKKKKKKKRKRNKAKTDEEEAEEEQSTTATTTSNDGETVQEGEEGALPEGYRTFFCEGKCGMNREYKPFDLDQFGTVSKIEDDMSQGIEPDPMQAMAAMYNDEYEKQEGELVKCEELTRDSMFSLDCTKYKKMSKCFGKAKQTFTVQYLNKFCRERSMVDLSKRKETMLNLGNTKKISKCIGEKTSVSCREITSGS